jgi:hypothetical protein
MAKKILKNPQNLATLAFFFPQQNVWSFVIMSGTANVFGRPSGQNSPEKI